MNGMFEAVFLRKHNIGGTRNEIETMEKKAQPVLCHCWVHGNLFDQKGIFPVSKHACRIMQDSE